MYNFNDLKEKIEVKEDSITCPIINCKKEVRRIRKGEKLRQNDFLCSDHNIYISPSTFDYYNEYSNLISLNQRDKDLFIKIKSTKRESRISRERSEDALSWNVFRYLDKQKYIQPFVKETLGFDIVYPEVILWSFSEKEKDNNGVLKELADARRQFGEHQNRSTEPDIIIKGDSVIIFIEAKFSSGNNTSGNAEKKIFRIENPKRYNQNWFSLVFKESYEKLINSGKYELMRLWLLGTWIANEKKVDFYLLNLTREKYEVSIEKDFRPLIEETKSNSFQRIKWEAIYDFILAQNDENNKVILEYIENKSCGFNSSGKKQRAFNRKPIIT